MNIQNNNFYTPQFTSKLNPINPTVIRTKYGKLNLREVRKADLANPKFLEKLSKFYCTNFSTCTDDPSWIMYNTVPKRIKNQMIENFVSYLRHIIKNDDGNMTLLLAKDKRNKIQGACLSYGYDLVDGSKDYILYVDSIAVNKTFRGAKLGKKMMQKTIEANKNNSSFTDVFLVGEKRALGFYKKLGFVNLIKKDSAQCKVSNFIALDREDYPKYVDFLTLPLKPEQPRWYSKIAQKISDTWIF